MAILKNSRSVEYNFFLKFRGKILSQSVTEITKDKFWMWFDRFANGNNKINVDSVLRYRKYCSVKFDREILRMPECRFGKNGIVKHASR